MTNFSKIPLSPMEDELLEYDDILNGDEFPIYLPEWNSKTHCIIYSFICATSILGLVGNGVVIWLLGFCMKRSPITIYILNLAVADFGVLISIVLFSLLELLPNLPAFVNHTADCLFPFTFCTSQFLLAAISIDRCVSVFFPIWHRCNRPPHLSGIVCAVIWVLNFLLCGIQIISKAHLLLYQIFVNTVLSFPLITISTLTLLFKVCFKPQQHKRGKLLTVILLTLLFFLIVALPFNGVVLFYYFSHYVPPYIFYYGFLCASLNSGINPLIYFLIGKKKRGQRRENLKAVLQRVFKEGEEYGEKPVHSKANCVTVM